MTIVEDTHIEQKRKLRVNAADERQLRHDLLISMCQQLKHFASTIKNEGHKYCNVAS